MEQPITFHFDNAQAAGQAADTLQELGYRTKTALSIFIDRSDLTSALEIAQTFGGEISMADSDYREASFPAHSHPGSVSEEPDWNPEGDFATISENHAYTDAVEDQGFDPSDEDYNQFSAGIHF